MHRLMEINMLSGFHAYSFSSQLSVDHELREHMTSAIPDLRKLPC